MAFEYGKTGAAIAAIRDGDDDESGRAALVGYLPIGFPSVTGSLAALRALTGEGDSPGVDLVELGIPYTDPVIDGVTVQRASTAALQRGVRTKDVFTGVETVAATGTPVVIMTYWNLVDRYGVDAFARDLASAGGAGLITPDLTPDEGAEWITAADTHGLDRVFLVSPSSTDERLARTVGECRGWVYATSVMGVTGARAATSSAAPELVKRVRAAVPNAIVGVGLGVSNGDQAAEVGEFADAVVVGSALVSTVLQADDAGRPDDLSGLRSLVADLASGVRRSNKSGQSGTIAAGTGLVPQ